MEQIRYTIVIENGILAGISQHTGNLDAVPLSLEQFTAIVPSINAAAIEKAESVEADTAATIAGKDATIAELLTLKSTMEAKVSDALQSNDPAKFVEVAIAFFDPVAAKRAELEAQKAALEAELAQLPQ